MLREAVEHVVVARVPDVGAGHQRLTLRVGERLDVRAVNGVRASTDSREQIRRGYTPPRKLVNDDIPLQRMSRHDRSRLDLHRAALDRFAAAIVTSNRNAL